MRLSVVIPAFNESANLKTTLAEIADAIRRCEGVASSEILIVDDHSTEPMYELARELGRELEKAFGAPVHCLRLSRRSGSHTAIRAGLLHAQGDAVLCISADGQDDPAALPGMVRKLQAGNQIVWASRRKRQETLLYALAAKLFYWTLRLLTRNALPASKLASADFFLLGRKVVDAINRCQERNTSLFGLLVWIGFAQDYVEYDRRPRRAGESKWSFQSRLRLAKDWIFAFSGIPLMISSYLGMTLAAFGFVYALVISVLAFLKYTYPGWAETAVIILVVGGAQMLLIGILGEYLWRNLDESRKRPLFFVEKSSVPLPEPGRGDRSTAD